MTYYTRATYHAWVAPQGTSLCILTRVTPLSTTTWVSPLGTHTHTHTHTRTLRAMQLPHSKAATITMEATLSCYLPTKGYTGYSRT